MTDLLAAGIEATRELLPGYTLLRTVNQGSVFDVHEVWSEERHCRCAAKTVTPSRAHESRARKRLLREARLLSRLSHPHIVRAYEIHREPEPVLILEALPGMTLEYWLSETERLAVNDVVHLGEHLCSAVSYLHNNGVLHLDLKPGNLLCSGGLVRVIDLSLARAPGRGRRGAGTHIYLAPEQALGDELSEASDAWGIGVVLWEAAAGRPPFDRPEDDRDAYEQLRRRAEPVGHFADLPQPLARVVDGCLEPKPEDRPSVAEISSVIDRFL
jgi:eukaryotic-like serine/threonine-protein kinase